MSTVTTTNYNEGAAAMPDDHEVFMFQAARQAGRRNALVDLEAQFAQVNTSIITCNVDQMTPHFQSMSLKP